MSRPFDIVVFGASGYTGVYIVEELARHYGDSGVNKWFIAGRNIEKLEKMLSNLSEITGYKHLLEIHCIYADVNDYESLINMAKQATVVINCVGPFRFYGEPVVEACIESGSHHLDISGENQFLEKIQLCYNEAAAKKDVYVIGACGFDSIPSELGVKYTSEQFKGELNEIESYIQFLNKKGMVIHYGTWLSAIHSVANRKELSELRTKLFTSLPSPAHPIRRRFALFYSEEMKKWCFPLLGSDKAVVYRSQRYLYETKQQNNLIQYSPYICASSLWSGCLILIAGLIFGFMSNFSFTRKLLEKWPWFFSFGKVSHEGATREQIKSSSLEIRFIAKGHLRDSENRSSSDETPKPPEDVLVTKLLGPDGGYITTSICVVQAAIIILTERDKMPTSGGVYPPGAAFWNTTYLKRVQDRGLVFENLTAGTTATTESSVKND